MAGKSLEYMVYEIIIRNKKSFPIKMIYIKTYRPCQVLCCQEETKATVPHPGYFGSYRMMFRNPMSDTDTRLFKTKTNEYPTSKALREVILNK